MCVLLVENRSQIKWQIIYDCTTKRLAIMRIQKRRRCRNNSAPFSLNERMLTSQTRPNQSDDSVCELESYHCRRRNFNIKSIWIHIHMHFIWTVGQTNQNVTKAIGANGNWVLTERHLVHTHSHSHTQYGEQTIDNVCTSWTHLWLCDLYKMNEWLYQRFLNACGFLCALSQFGFRLFCHWIL